MKEEEYLDSLPNDSEKLAIKYQLELLGVILNRLSYLKDHEITVVDEVNDKKAMKAITLYYSSKIVDEYRKTLLKSANHLQEQAKYLYEYKGIEQVPLIKNKVIKSIINENSKKFQKEFYSKTTGFLLDEQFHSTKDTYRKAINKAVQAVRSGDDYYTAIQKTVSDLGGGGARVLYPSGYSKRMDSAVRMNVLDGVREVNAQIREEQGKEFGADGYEISVHGLSAPDHVNIQGKQYSLKEYKELNESLKRPIGTLNCHHFAYPIILGISEPNYTSEQLNDFKNKSEAKNTVKGKEYTGYETTQKQREYELRLRKLKEKQMAFNKVGDSDNARRVQRDILQTEHDYAKFSKTVGLKTKPKRASVPLYKRIPIND